MPLLATTRIDGRRARSARARDAIVDALLDLMQEGDVRPTASRIAERAGVSLRTVFQHFRDLEGLLAAAADRQTTRLLALAREVPAAGPLAARLDAFVRGRTRLLDALAPVRRGAVLAEPFSREIARRLRGARARGRAEIARVFAPELAACPPAERRERLAALAALGEWPLWESLRRHEGLSAAQARRVVARLLRALLEEDR
ncbi:MAG TPA: TetR family transcriptional regulator [Candidatus Binatia bacterium]|nr:TetR family transcriptional regulator [Candidatus Binatia bacterium]